MREFITAADDDFNDEDEIITYVVDGEKLEFYKPSSSQQVIMMGMPRDKNDHRAVRNFLSLFFEICVDETRNLLDERLLDRHDHFGIKHIFQIFEGLMEDWSARPTGKPSASQRSRRTTGSTSTAKAPTKASTSSRSRSRASSTS